MRRSSWRILVTVLIACILTALTFASKRGAGLDEAGMRATLRARAATEGPEALATLCGFYARDTPDPTEWAIYVRCTEGASK